MIQNLISLILSILAWVFIIFLVVRYYKKQLEKPKLWKAFIVLLLGLFTFSFDCYVQGTLVKIPLLPLGVWLLYIIFMIKKNNWSKYRPYAWLGFLANFIFLVAALIAMPIQHFIYSPDKLSTYVSNIEHASIIVTHPSGKNSLLDKESLLKQIPNMKEKVFYSDQWYNEVYENYDNNRMKERFPYQLVGVKASWGSGLSSMMFIENDGKGLLISTSNKQYYFRSKELLVKGGE